MDKDTLIACVKIAHQRVKDTWAAHDAISPGPDKDHFFASCLEAITIMGRLSALDKTIDWAALGLTIPKE